MYRTIYRRRVFNWQRFLPVNYEIREYPPHKRHILCADALAPYSKQKRFLPMPYVIFLMGKWNRYFKRIMVAFSDEPIKGPYHQIHAAPLPWCGGFMPCNMGRRKNFDQRVHWFWSSDFNSSGMYKIFDRWEELEEYDYRKIINEKSSMYPLKPVTMPLIKLVPHDLKGSFEQSFQ